MALEEGQLEVFRRPPSLSPPVIMACIFFPRERRPSAFSINIPRARGERKYWFLFTSRLVVGQTKEGEEKFSPFFLLSFYLFHGSWKVIAEQVAWKDVEEGTEKSNFREGRQTYRTPSEREKERERGGEKVPHFHTPPCAPRARWSIFGALV